MVRQRHEAATENLNLLGNTRSQRPVGAYVVDFYCAAAYLVVELDGATHDSDAAQRYDAARTEYLNSAGLRVLRFNNEDVMSNLEGVMFEIERVVGERLLVRQRLRTLRHPSATPLPCGHLPYCIGETGNHVSPAK